ncbi:hypothetical protein Rxycam_03181 [Rubrobacter xylanophilus DSM 9941]|nr:hypothetical protein Rxycam_03181 [Rubrobacter xylanophilus DSM 9941]
MPRRKKEKLRFEQRLVLNQYMLGLFGVETFDELAEGLKEPEYEEWDENNVSRIHHVLAARFFDLPERTGGPSVDDLLRYDQNIVGHTLKISEKRDERVRWKYFQYLSFLFAEIYLDRYFRDPEALLDGLNNRVRSFNEGKAEASQVPEYVPDDLRKLAFWMATGSGKTLLMHVNVLQYRHYLELHGRTGELDRIILLTPNEGLSRQHLRELEKSGFEAELFSRSSESLFTSQRIQILEITKLREDTGVKTVAVEAFEGNNLVLVDEGHRGTSKASDVIGDKGWKPMRDALCKDGFSFEYSATFGQAMKAAKNKKLTDEYAKCILFDYSYRYFYGDGYGKDYRILNLEEGSDESFRHRYLVAALLSFHQQQLLYRDREKELQPYGIERPLWMFVGSSVTKSPSKDDRTDVINILRFLARFVREREESVGILKRLLSGRTGLSYKGRDLFADSFGYLKEKGLAAEKLYDSILSGFFNAAGRAMLHASVLKEAEGEISLHLGDNKPFGVINVGDPSALSKLLEEQEEIVVSEQSVSGSLFDALNTRESGINLLVGARKFTEGWSSWRVSSMGLMNVGKNEGSQIIQLFGRGVRLKGLNFSLKRSSQIPYTRHPRHIEILDRHIEILETLNVFGVSADYMQQFKEHLEEEGLPSNDNIEEIILPVSKTLNGKKLKTIRLKEGVDFRENGPRPELDTPNSLCDALARKLPVKLDWYPKVSALESRNGAVTAVRDAGKLEPRHLAFINLDEVYFDLVRYKNERGWHNLTISKEKVVELLKNPGWYELAIPSEDLEFSPGNLGQQVRTWQEIATSLLKAYCKKYYDTRRAEFESKYLRYQELSEEDDNFLEEYRFQVEASKEDYIRELRDLKTAIESGQMKPVSWGALDIFSFDRHLYRPLVHLKNKDVSVKPVALNEGERQFVKDLKSYYQTHPDFFEERELYLLRNMSRGRGIGFFEAGNFYPDFILWLLAGDHQYVAFIDPKGITRLRGVEDPKIAFKDTIKEIEERLTDPNVTLSSFIISNTPYDEIAYWGMSKKDLEDRHVLFQKDDKNTYIEDMLKRILAHS